MSDALHAIFERRSIRKFKNTQLSGEQLELLRQAALASPSARNMQPWQFVFVQDAEMLDEITQTTVQCLFENGDEKTKENLEKRGKTIFYGAPTVIFIFGDRTNPWSTTDCGIAVENLAIAAQSINLGSCIIGLVKEAFNCNRSLYSKLAVPDSHDFCIAIAIGYPDMTKEAHDFRPDRITIFES